MITCLNGPWSIFLDGSGLQCQRTGSGVVDGRSATGRPRSHVSADAFDEDSDARSLHALNWPTVCTPPTSRARTSSLCRPKWGLFVFTEPVAFVLIEVVAHITAGSRATYLSVARTGHTDGRTPSLQWRHLVNSRPGVNLRAATLAWNASSSNPDGYV